VARSIGIRELVMPPMCIDCRHRLQPWRLCITAAASTKTAPKTVPQHRHATMI
jgi:hypothetical protein